MNFFIKELLSHIQRHIDCPLCVRCGSYFVRENYFCNDCADNFFRSHFNEKINMLTPSLHVRSFIQWRKYESDSLSEYIYLLKTKRSYLAWRWLVLNLQHYICQFIHPGSGTLLIPVPGSRTSYHTHYFCAAVQELTGCESLHALVKSAQQLDQKTLTAKSRKGAKFLINEEITERLSAARQIYLVDDIITTGATLKNISEAIRHSAVGKNNRGLKISGLTLFYREMQGEL